MTAHLNLESNAKESEEGKSQAALCKARASCNVRSLVRATRAVVADRAGNSPSLWDGELVRCLALRNWQPVTEPALAAALYSDSAPARGSRSASGTNICLYALTRPEPSRM